jgi:hypothetical protein
MGLDMLQNVVLPAAAIALTWLQSIFERMSTVDSMGTMAHQQLIRAHSETRGINSEDGRCVAVGMAALSTIGEDAELHSPP